MATEAGPPPVPPAVAPPQTAVTATALTSATTASLHQTHHHSRLLPKPPTPTSLSSIASAGLRASPSPSPISPIKPLAPKSPLFSGAQRPVLTGEAALSSPAQQQPRTSPNLSVATLHELRNINNQPAMSRPHDAPKLTSPLPKTESMQLDKNPPPSSSIPDTLDPALAGKSNEPSPSSTHLMPPSTLTDHDAAVRSQTYPGPLPPPQPSSNSVADSNNNNNTPNREPILRGMSLPMAGYGADGQSPRSPSSTSSGAKKHKCPYCNTDFTRHHNLKSHLLTHSQEKPYVCQTCQARFRRLHDLKRHSKLHTGERPHRCNRCGRQFARGDALARHNKGQGGCAGRRTSVGSFADDDDGGFDPADQDQMEGLQYNDNLSANGGDDLTEDERRRRSLPGIQPPRPPPNNTANGPHVETAPMYQSQYPRSYPPALSRQSNSLQPPAPSHQNSSSSPTTASHPTLSPKPPSVSTSSHGPNSAAVFAHGGMTESPKPLSPGAVASHQLGTERHRSPSSYPQPLHSMSRLPPPQSTTQGPSDRSGPTLPPLAPPPSASQQNSASTSLSSYHHSTSLPTPNPSFPPPTTTISGSTAASGSSAGTGHKRSLSGSEGAGAPGSNGGLPSNVDRLFVMYRAMQDELLQMKSRLETLEREKAAGQFHHQPQLPPAPPLPLAVPQSQAPAPTESK